MELKGKNKPVCNKRFGASRGATPQNVSWGIDRLSPACPFVSPRLRQAASQLKESYEISMSLPTHQP